MTYQHPTTQTKVNSTLTKQKTLTASSNLLDHKPPKKSLASYLRTKIILGAISLSVIPVAVLGAIGYKVAQNAIGKQVNQAQQERIHHLSEMFEKFATNRISEAQTLATNPIFTNPNIMGTVTPNQKKEALNAFQDQMGFYDSIVYLDPEGNPLYQSQSEFPLKENYSDRAYFQEAIRNKQISLNGMGISKYTGKARVEFAVPVKDAWTDKVIGVLRFRIPSQELIPVFDNYIVPNEQWHVINTEGILFASSLENLDNQPFANYFPEIKKAHDDKQMVNKLVKNPSNPDQEQIINYAPVKLQPAYADLNIGTAIAIDTDIAFARLKPLKWIYIGGTIGTALLVGSLAGFLANRIIKPVLQLTATVNQLSLGKLNTRVQLNRKDELGVLGNSINEMAQKLDFKMQRQQTIAKSSELIAQISQARSLRELQRPFSSFLAEIRNILATDRVVFYQFNREWFGTVIAESVAPDFPRTLGVQFDDPCFAQEYVRKYQRGRIQAVTDIYEANLSECHLKQLEPYQVRSSLVLPVMLEKSVAPETEKLIGLLIVHQCSSPRAWKQSEIDYLQQTIAQLSMVLKGYMGVEEENWQKANLQQDLSGVLERMKNVAQGDLRNSKNNLNDSGNSNTVTSFDNAIANLGDTVQKITVPSKQIVQQLKSNQQDVTEFKDRLKQQTNQLALVFAFVEQLTSSISEVSDRVGTTSGTVNSVVTDLESEKAKFQQAISFMSELDASLRQNTDKIKNLRHASQKMGKVINSIRKINLRASLLASKLSKRIPELDDSVYGLKEEIQSIQQSIAATKELENVVQGIDREIADILQEYKVKENKLEQENYLVANVGQNLEQIVQTTRNTQQQMFSIANMTRMQVQTFQKINGLKQEINTTSTSLSALSDRTLSSLAQTSLTAQDLENVIDFFKLESSSD